jgi:transcription factor IIIB subunit 2
MRKLSALAHALRLGDSIAESAHRFFTLAVSNGFGQYTHPIDPCMTKKKLIFKKKKKNDLQVMGRRSPYVLASCTYVACRMAKLPTMLIDISDLLQVGAIHSILRNSSPKQLTH